LPPGHCRDLEVVLDDYLDGDLPVARRRQLLAHIRACAPCASRLEELRALLRLLRGLAGPAAPRSLRTAVWERLCREPRRPGRRQLPPPA
jgi:anti-sigma factor RsiW